MEVSLTESLEDYLVSIFEISKECNVVRINEIAKKSGVRVSSAFNAVKTLVEKNFVTHERYGYVLLTDYGIEQARILYERRKTLLSLLINVVGVSENVAIRDVHKIEHDLSKETLEALVNSANYFMRERNADKKQQITTNENIVKVTLKDLKVGESGKILAIRREAGSLKSKLLTMGAVAGVVARVEKVAPLGDPVDVLMLGYHLSLRKEEAEQIIVERI